MLCYSTGSLPDRFTLPRIADTLAGTPFLGVELVLTAAMLERAADAKHWHAARDLFHAQGLAFRSVHLGAPFLMGPEAHKPGLSSLDDTGRKRKALAVAKAVMVAAFLDCPSVCLTTGQPEPGAALEDQVSALRAEIANLAKSLPAGIRLQLEQEPEHVIHSAAQMKALADGFPGVLTLTFDVGHSHVLGEDIGAALRDLGTGRLSNIHLEDIRGRVHQHRLYGDGDVDFASVFSALHDIGYRGDFTPDLYPFKDDHERAMRASLDFLRHHGVLTRAL